MIITNLPSLKDHPYALAGVALLGGCHPVQKGLWFGSQSGHMPWLQLIPW